MADNFDAKHLRNVEVTLDYEGACVGGPDDRGDKSKFGISKQNCPHPDCSITEFKGRKRHYFYRTGLAEPILNSHRRQPCKIHPLKNQVLKPQNSG